MFYEPDKNDHGLKYNPIKACVVPRPIGWITSMSEAGEINLAPFSWFNGLSYDPPFVCFSIGGHTDDGQPKDTVVNIEATGEFVYNMATWDQREEVSHTAFIVDRGVDELDAAGLKALPSKFVKPPRVKGSPVQFECTHFQTMVLPGNKPSSTHQLIVGRVIGVHIDDNVITQDGLLDTLKMRPIARLGYKEYTSVDSTFEMEKTTPEELIGKPEAAE